MSMLNKMKCPLCINGTFKQGNGIVVYVKKDDSAHPYTGYRETHTTYTVCEKCAAYHPDITRRIPIKKYVWVIDNFNERVSICKTREVARRILRDIKILEKANGISYSAMRLYRIVKEVVRE